MIQITRVGGLPGRPAREKKFAKGDLAVLYYMLILHQYCCFDV